MPEQTSKGMQCHEFDILLADAFDGILSGSQLDRFQTHARACPACGPLFADAEAGRNWLKSLTEVEPPAGLVENILASTTGIATSRLRHLAPSTRPRTSWLERLQASIAVWSIPSGQPSAASVRHVVWHGVLLAVGCF